MRRRVVDARGPSSRATIPPPVCVKMPAEDVHVEAGHRRSLRISTRARAARLRTFLQGLAAGSGAAHVDEQPGPGSRGEARRFDRLWRARQGGAQLELLSRDCGVAALVG